MATYEIKDNTSAHKIKDVDTTARRIVLYAAAFGNEDSHGDIIERGAFKKTIAENTRVKHLWQHDSDKPVGKPESMLEDAEGLLVTSKISDTALGRDLLTLVQDGVMNENSVGFMTIKSRNDEEKGLRYLSEVKLWEYSSVTWGSNPNTPNLAVKSISEKEKSDELLLKLSQLQKSLRTGNLTDETCHLLEIKVVQIQQAIADLLATPLAPTEPEIISTPELVVEPVEVKQAMIDWSEFYSAYKK